MKVTTCTRLEFSGSYIGEMITTKECCMSTGYRGRGLPSVSKKVPAGSKGRFILERNGNNTKCWLTVTIPWRSDECGSVEKHVTFEMPIEDAAKKLHLA